MDSVRVRDPLPATYDRYFLLLEVAANHHDATHLASRTRTRVSHTSLDGTDLDDASEADPAPDPDLEAFAARTDPTGPPSDTRPPRSGANGGPSLRLAQDAFTQLSSTGKHAWRQLSDTDKGVLRDAGLSVNFTELDSEPDADTPPSDDVDRDALTVAQSNVQPAISATNHRHPGDPRRLLSSSKCGTKPGAAPTTRSANTTRLVPTMEANIAVSVEAHWSQQEPDPGQLLKALPPVNVRGRRYNC